MNLTASLGTPVPLGPRLCKPDPPAPAPTDPLPWPAGVLSRETTLEVLTKHNAWRRGGDGPQTDPRMLGLALDAAIAAISGKEPCPTAS